ncbi:MAG: glycosyltransferase family 2 protein [Merismopedia sp. SIO2A8]|nr:glycosyltransferase family 2 protein [Merismopedia sp. SIO2A8]
MIVMVGKSWHRSHQLASLSDTSSVNKTTLMDMKDGSGRRRKAAATLTVVWSSTLALHLVPGGSWLVFGLTAMIGLHALRVLFARPRSLPAPLSVDDGSNPDEWPYISILVAAKNEEAVIRRLVENLCALDYPTHRYDVWMIDDSSTDETPKILTSLAQSYKNLQVICRPPGAGGGKSGALNQVWPLTQGNLIAVFDADAQVPTDLLRRVVPLFDRQSVGAVQVRKAIANASENFWTKGQASEMLLDAYFQEKRIAIGGIGELRGNGQFVRRNALEDCQGWNEETITDDLDLTLKLHINNWDIDLMTCPSVQEEGVTTATGLWHQRNRWAEGGYQRYLDYWRPIVQNRLGPAKSLDLLVFCITQYIIPTAAVPDLMVSLMRNRLPLLSPLTTLTVLLSFIGMSMGLRRVRLQEAQLAQRSWPDAGEVAIAPVQHSLQPELSFLGSLAQAMRGTLYMTHWFIVIVGMTLRVAIRQKRLKWVKTVHHGANLNNPALGDGLGEPEPSGEA